MPVVVSTSLIGSAQRLEAADAKRVWAFLEKFTADPANKGISLERAVQAKDKNVWSARITQNLRAILHHEGDTWMVLYAGQHDDAYDWAASRRVERHVATGALQIVESPEVVERLAEADRTATEAPGLFDAHGDGYLLSLGVPESWLPTMRKIASEDVLLEAIAKLPEEVADRLLDLAGGKFVTPPAPLPASRPAIESPDSQRRFFMLDGSDDLRRLLDAPLATWIAFLHPSQRRLASGTFSGPLKVTGSAGTGKTVVALHRARDLAAQGKRVLLTTYVTTLGENLRRNLALICSPDELDRITIGTVHSVARSIALQENPKLWPIDARKLNERIEECRVRSGCTFDKHFVRAEWNNVIAAQGIETWDAYRAASRAGRGVPLSAKDRKVLWGVFEHVYMSLYTDDAMDWAGFCRIARRRIESGRGAREYDAVIVDEVQDLGPQELRLLAALAGDGQDALTLVGDGGQRIYAGRYSLKSLGIDVRGRSHVLRINYRTTEQIKRFAERVRGMKADDLDDGTYDSRRTRSLFGGPDPVTHACADADEQAAFIASRIGDVIAGGIQPGEIAVFARKGDLLDPILKRLEASGIACAKLAKGGDGQVSVSLATMHRAKGLEFKVVFVADASDDTVPLPSAANESDPQERADALELERNLLYVSVTRARHEAFVSWVGAPSRFLSSLVPAS